MSAKYKWLDIQNQKFNRLTALTLSDKSHYQADYWNCLCDCGNSVVLLTRQIIKGNVKSCGCLLRESSVRVGKNNTTHGFHGTRQYQTWSGMKARCNNQKNDAYVNYGGRGISYDARWENFEEFWEDMSKGYSDNLTLDRIDPNGNYTKENCRWVDSYLQAINKNTPITNTSGTTGVSWEAANSNWRVRISVDGKRLCLGAYKDYDEAVTIRKQAELHYYGENFGN